MHRCVMAVSLQRGAKPRFPGPLPSVSLNHLYYRSASCTINQVRQRKGKSFELKLQTINKILLSGSFFRKEWADQENDT
jgi:hypothetical protein